MVRRDISRGGAGLIESGAKRTEPHANGFIGTRQAGTLRSIRLLAVCGLSQIRRRRLTHAGTLLRLDDPVAHRNHHSLRAGYRTQFFATVLDVLLHRPLGYIHRLCDLIARPAEGRQRQHLALALR